MIPRCSSQLCLVLHCIWSGSNAWAQLYLPFVKLCPLQPLNDFARRFRLQYYCSLGSFATFCISIHLTPLLNVNITGFCQTLPYFALHLVKSECSGLTVIVSCDAWLLWPSLPCFSCYISMVFLLHRGSSCTYLIRNFEFETLVSGLQLNVAASMVRPVNSPVHKFLIDWIPLYWHIPSQISKRK